MIAVVFSGVAAHAGLAMFAWFLTGFIARRTNGSPLGGLVSVGIVVLAFAAIQTAFYLIVLKP